MKLVISLSHLDEDLQAVISLFLVENPLWLLLGEISLDDFYGSSHVASFQGSLAGSLNKSPLQQFLIQFEEGISSRSHIKIPGLNFVCIFPRFWSPFRYMFYQFWSQFCFIYSMKISSSFFKLSFYTPLFSILIIIPFIWDTLLVFILYFIF